MAMNNHASMRQALENEDILTNIFECLEFPTDVCRLAFISRSWRAASDRDVFWKSVNVQNRDVSPDVLCSILRRHPQVSTLNARGVELYSDHLAEVLPLLTNLAHLELEKTFFSVEDINLLSQNLKHLKHLSLAGGIYSNADAPGAGAGAHHHHHHHQLQLINHLQQQQQQQQQQQGNANPIVVEQPSDSDDDEDDEEEEAVNPNPIINQLNGPINVGDALLWASRSIPARFSHPTLRSLVIEKSTTPCIIIACPNLMRLRLDQFIGVKICLRGCTALEEVHLRGGTRTAEVFARCLLGIAGGVDGGVNHYIRSRNDNLGLPLQMLHTLVLESNQCITDSVLEGCATRFRHLTRLELHGCASVSGAGLGGGEPNAAAAHAWESLTELHISNCDSLTGTQLSTAANCMFSLRKLSIEGCTALTAINIDSRSLRSLEIRAPDHLSSLELNTSNLETFDLYYDNNTGRASALVLRRLSINSASLKKLSLAGCPLLNDIQLGCPYLQELELIECDALLNTEIQLTALHSPIALPELKKVSFHGCHMLSSIYINSAQTQEVGISACKELSNLRLQCDMMSTMQLGDCSFLATIEVASQKMIKMSLGNCPNLQRARLCPLPILEELDLSGCNLLRTITLNSPKLRKVDASLCSSFTDEAIAALACCSRIEELQIGACAAVTTDGITAIGVLKLLHTVDISYMPLQDPRPLFESIRRVTALRLTNNYAMDPDALCSMVLDLYNKSDILRFLDVSYCNIGPELAAKLAARCRLPLSLAVKGIRGAPGDGKQHQLWPELNSKIGSPVLNSEILSLSMDSSRGVDAFYLGLVPKDLAMEHNLQGVPVDGEIWTMADSPFLKTNTPLLNLKQLNIGVGEFHKVAIALPQLESLQLNNCSKLSEVTLLCPKLTTLSLAACRSMSAEGILTAIKGCPLLTNVDISLCPGTVDVQALSARIRRQHSVILDIAVSPVKTPKSLN